MPAGGRNPKMTDETRLIRAGSGPRPLVKTVGPPIQRGSTVLLPSAAALYGEGQTYGREGLSAQAALVEALAEMEGAAEVCLFPSGTAAVTGALFAVLKAGDGLMVVDTIYGPTRRFCDKVLKRYGVEVSYFDPTQAPEELVASAPVNTRLILMETPGSLSLEMQDQKHVAELATARGILTATDNTWGAGYLYKPLEHGIDISIQALTKYPCGHSDVFMGSAAARDPKVAKLLKDSELHLGWAVSGDEAYHLLRGLRTMPTRLKRHEESALTVARWLAEQPQVARVIHPALPDHPGHDLFKRDFKGSNGLFSFVLKPGAAREVDAVLDRLELFGLGFSWGGFESLAIPCDPQFAFRRFARSYGGPMVRLHVGLEDPADLIADLAQALAPYRGT
jgi:cystathionine beta-lyase